MGLLFFMMAFVNTVVNNLSISLVVTAPGGGPGVIPFLTAYAAFPLTLGATVLYAYASHYVSSRKLFTITVGIFAAFNLVFALCLFPNHEVLHLPGVADALSKVKYLCKTNHEPACLGASQRFEWGCWNGT